MICVLWCLAQANVKSKWQKCVANVLKKIEKGIAQESSWLHKMVVVQHELAGQGLFGVHGVVFKVKGNSLHLERHGLAPVVIDCSHVIVWAESMQPKKGLKVQHMSRGAKVEVLVTWGLLHADGERLEGLPPTGTVNCSSAHLDCWWS